MAREVGWEARRCCLVLEKASLPMQIGTCLAMEELRSLVWVLVHLNMEPTPCLGQFFEHRKIKSLQKKREKVPLRK